MKLIVEVEWIPEPEDIIFYLREKGWKACPPCGVEETWLVYNKLNMYVEFPSVSKYADYHTRISQFFHSISAIEKRDEYKIWQEIQRLKRDRKLYNL